MEKITTKPSQKNKYLSMIKKLSPRLMNQRLSLMISRIKVRARGIRTLIPTVSTSQMNLYKRTLKTSKCKPEVSRLFSLIEKEWIPIRTCWRFRYMHLTWKITIPSKWQSHMFLRLRFFRLLKFLRKRTESPPESVEPKGTISQSPSNQPKCAIQ